MINKQGSNKRRKINLQYNNEKIDILHRRWVHSSESAIKHTLKLEKVKGSGYT